MIRFVLPCILIVSLSRLVTAAPTSAPTTAPATQSADGGAPNGRIEIDDDPAALLNATTPVQRFTLHGVALGDDASHAPRRDVDENSAGGDASWLRLRKSGDAYLVRGGKVTKI